MAQKIDFWALCTALLKGNVLCSLSDFRCLENRISGSSLQGEAIPSLEGEATPSGWHVTRHAKFRT